MKNSFKETDCLTKENIIDLHKCCEAVAEKVLKIYNKPINVTYKKDQTPLSEADKCSHELLTAFLKKNFPTIPILSEEMSEITPFELRKEWAQFWLVDPLDGTKEFIKKNGQFCFCIALIRNNVPVFGFIHAPTTGVSYYGVKEYGAYKITDDNHIKLEQVNEKSNTRRVIGSLSHSSPEFDQYIQQKKNNGLTVDVVQMGSALKFCLIAEGKADEYPRFGPTMEWDTAAGQIIVEECGKQVIDHETQTSLLYNKKVLRNAFFTVS